MKRTLATLIVLFGACAEPPVVPTQDALQNSRGGRIEGSVVVLGAARGNAVVFLYDEEALPPPQGAGRPISFAFVPSAALFGPDGAPGDTGPFTAPFVFSLVPQGRYQLRGFLDRDGCQPSGVCRAADFIPWYSVTAEPNAGDWGGAAVDATGAPRRVELRASDDGRVSEVSNLSVGFTSAGELVTDRPAFRVVEGEATLNLASGPKRYTLEAAPLDIGPVHHAKPTFLVQAFDVNGDGVPDDLNGDDQPDVWPRVVVRKLAGAATPLLDENDVDRDGLIDQTGADYAHLDASGNTVPPDGRPDAVVLSARLDLSALLPLLRDENGAIRATPTPLTTLPFFIDPVALDVSNPRAPARLAAVPSGVYAVTVVQRTGQTWRLPNELAPALAARAELPPVESQGFVLTVP